MSNLRDLDKIILAILEDAKDEDGHMGKDHLGLTVDEIVKRINLLPEDRKSAILESSE